MLQNTPEAYIKEGSMKEDSVNGGKLDDSAVQKVRTYRAVQILQLGKVGVQLSLAP